MKNFKEILNEGIRSTSHETKKQSKESIIRKNELKKFLNEKINKKERFLKRWVGDGRGFKGNQYITYHGTTLESAKDILKRGLKTMAPDSPRWFMLTTSKKAAKHFSIGYKKDKNTKTTILQITIPRDKIVELLHKGIETSFNDIQHAIKNIIPSKYIKIV